MSLFELQLIFLLPECLAVGVKMHSVATATLVLIPLPPKPPTEQDKCESVPQPGTDNDAC